MGQEILFQKSRWIVSCGTIFKVDPWLSLCIHTLTLVWIYTHPVIHTNNWDTSIKFYFITTNLVQCIWQCMRHEPCLMIRGQLYRICFFSSFYLHVCNPLQGLNSGHNDFIASACIQQTILLTQCNATASVDDVFSESWSCVLLRNFWTAVKFILTQLFILKLQLCFFLSVKGLLIAPAKDFSIFWLVLPIT